MQDGVPHGRTLPGRPARPGSVDQPAAATGTPLPTPTPTPPCASSPECDSPNDDERLGCEILEVQSRESIRGWISPNITRAQFDALDLPPGWIKDQPREGDRDARRFHRSPGATVDGEFLDAELFGFEWRHSATTIRAGFALDEAGLLIGSTVVKSHEVTFEAGRTVYVLVSPDDEAYFRIGRDADRTRDVPTIPDTWRLVEYVTPERLASRLPAARLVIRTDNQDSFQDPVHELAVAF
mgnify:FL=1